MNAWVAIVAVGLASYGLRASFVVLAHRWTVPPRLARVLPLAPVAVLAAVVAPTLFTGAASGWGRLAGAAVAAVVAHRTRSIGLTVAAGLPVAWVVAAVTTG